MATSPSRTNVGTAIAAARSRKRRAWVHALAHQLAASAVVLREDPAAVDLPRKPSRRRFGTARCGTGARHAAGGGRDAAMIVIA